MKNINGFLFYFLILSFCFSYGQQKLGKKDMMNKQLRDSSRLRAKTKAVLLSSDASIEDYSIVDVRGKKTFVDTSLSLRKNYKFNYLRKDDFGLIQFANIGQSYNSLIKNVTSSWLLPRFGARARHFNYFEIDDIKYYNVPTPFTELMFKTAFQQGQLLDAVFAVNTSERFNFSIAYKGLRSLGNYQNALTSSGNFRLTTSYTSKDKRYNVKAHMVTQDLLNQENGGLRDEDLVKFTSGDDEFIDRSVFDPNFDNAENVLVGKRFYLNHDYNLRPQIDSMKPSFVIKHILSFEDKYFQFDQTSSSSFFGDSFNANAIRDRVTLENFETDLSLNYTESALGVFVLGIRYSNINYGYDKITVLDNTFIPNRIKDQLVSLHGNYSNRFGKLGVNAEVKANVYGEFDSRFLRTNISYAFNKDMTFDLSTQFSSSPVNYNLLLNQSNYVNYNWYNLDRFSNVNTTLFNIAFTSSKLFNANLEYAAIENFSLFSIMNDSGTVKPIQLDQSVAMAKIRIDKEFRFGHFALDNAMIYQYLDDASNSINIPEFVVRNTFYYSNHLFKNNALFLQTGITFNYFTDYFMDAYDPLLAEFYSQNETKLGGYPRLDFFINAKIRQTRIFLKAEHFNASFTGYDYFSAPNHPYRDFALRFGVVWNFFL